MNIYLITLTSPYFTPSKRSRKLVIQFSCNEIVDTLTKDRVKCVSSRLARVLWSFIQAFDRFFYVRVSSPRQRLWHVGHSTIYLHTCICLSIRVGARRWSLAAANGATARHTHVQSFFSPCCVNILLKFWNVPIGYHTKVSGFIL